VRSTSNTREIARKHKYLKPRAILLLEADFNTVCKIIFNGRMISRLEEDNAILKEIIGSRRM